MYQGLFDDKHFIAPVDMQNFKRKKSIPTGYYDKNILCEKCDNQIISNLETFAKKVLYGGNGSPTDHPIIEKRINQLNQKILHIENLDYAKFKLFLLSIIWRSSISKIPFFKVISLGKHENTIRDMIYHNDPGKDTDFPVGLMILTKNKNQPTKLIAEPIQVRADNDNLAVIFLINESVIFCKIEGNESIEFYNEIAIKEKNSMDIYLIDERYNTDFMDAYLKRKLRFKS